MSWFFKMIRVAGANFPGSASLVQLQAELDSEKFEDRLKNLEDPISCLHEDISKLSSTIYGKFRELDSISLDFDEKFYNRYSRALAVFETNRLISKNSVMGSRIPLGINLIDPSFILYMAKFFEDSNNWRVTSFSNVSAKVFFW